MVDIVRLDHFRGFAGYWEIPGDAETAIDGQWVPGPGADFLQKLKAALGELPIIAEDLGVITADVVEMRERFELPGMKKEDIEVSLNDGTLTITGERKSETEYTDAEVSRAERHFGRFQRTISLSADVAVKQVKADYRDGVLTVTLPKAEEAKPKQISVNVG